MLGVWELGRKQFYGPAVEICSQWHRKYYSLPVDPRNVQLSEGLCNRRNFLPQSKYHFVYSVAWLCKAVFLDRLFPICQHSKDVSHNCLKRVVIWLKQLTRLVLFVFGFNWCVKVITRGTRTVRFDFFFHFQLQEWIPALVFSCFSIKEVNISSETI